MSMLDLARRPTGFRQVLASSFLLIGMTITVGSALLFQYVGGYIPCALCLKERLPYYVAVPIALVAFVLAAGRAPAPITRGLILLIGVIMLISVALGVYHAGVEWHFWPGPTGCSQVGGGDLSSGNLLADIDAVHPPSCDAAAGRFIGISFAGWNAIVSALFAAIGLRSAFAKADRFS
ncbi:disulfide bond formation protein B [Jiella sp. MQZ9-1]|uniref:Disulfide bond formation protein B n=1 Tax=Jiella flava TaxID=2816857 RepID=A0A939JXF6_9HYPH|nr:disulfide bond formation protein B [Jiella flava]MBO0664549.1 disulfide bond formation protein B [Jiella flava]MCD2473195.1 disulfide bond formation protein B [Jiella flava]